MNRNYPALTRERERLGEKLTAPQWPRGQYKKSNICGIRVLEHEEKECGTEKKKRWRNSG